MDCVNVIFPCPHRLTGTIKINAYKNIYTGISLLLNNIYVYDCLKRQDVLRRYRRCYKYFNGGHQRI